MIGLQIFRHIPTSLEINGPILSFISNPSNVSVANSGNVSFTGIATATFPTQTPSNPAENTGTLSYQWYNQNGALSNGTRTNLDGTITTISGVTSSTLSITNVQYVSDNQNQYYLSVDYVPSAYAIGKSTPNAINEPFSSTPATLTVYSYLSILLQPVAIPEGSTETFSIFNINATTSNPIEDNLITYQWRLNGVNLTNSSNVAGATTKQLSIKQPVGTYTIDCVVSHPNTLPASVTSTSVSYTTLDPRKFIVIEDIDTSISPGRVVSSTANLNSGPFNLTGKRTVVFSAGEAPASTLSFLYAPEKDLDVVVEMAAAGGQSFNGVQGGQGGWGVFRMTLKKDVEYSIKLGPNDGSFGPWGGIVVGNPIRGGVGGGMAVMYEKNRVIAVLGGGGGAGAAAAGGDGGGFNQAGQNGFGRKGGRGGSNEAPTGGGEDRFIYQGRNSNGGVLGICPKGGGEGGTYWRTVGLGDCQDYTQSGPFRSAYNGLLYPATASINRGFRDGDAGRVNGGMGLDGAGGGGGGGSRGGQGAQGNGNGGGGGSGYFDTGIGQILSTIPGVNSGNAYFRVKMYNVTDPIPSPPVPPPPNYFNVDWNDSRNPGYKTGTEGVAGGSDQTVPGAFIEGPGGSIVSPPFDYAQAFSRYRSGNGGSGIFFTPSNDYNSDGISYVYFKLVLKKFGPRALESSDIYLTSNRGNRDPNRGTVRKWYNPPASVTNPTLYTSNPREAFVPFRIQFDIAFACLTGGNYRVLYMTKNYEWDYFEKKDIEFTSGDLASQNGLGGGRLYFPDAFAQNYSDPRIVYIRSTIINRDTNEVNTINMFSEGTTSTDERRRDNVLEYGRYVIS